MAIREPSRTGRQSVGVDQASHRIDWRNPSERQVLDFIRSQVVRHDQHHHRWVKRAKLQLAWAAGDQLKRWDNMRRDLADSYDVQTGRIALFVNRLKPAILNWISLVTARPVSFRVSPATADDVDIASARVQDKLARYYWKKLLGDKQFVDSLWLMFCTGCAFFKSTWDPLLGGEFKVGPTDVFESDEFESAQLYGGNGTTIRQRFTNMLGSLLGIEPAEVALDNEGQFEVHDGDLDCTLLTGFDIIPPQHAYSIDKAPWLIVRQHRHMEGVRQRYGKKAAQLNPSTGTDFIGSLDSGIDAIGAYGSGDPLAVAVGSPDHVRVYELWRPVSKGCPKGYHAIAAQNVMMKRGPNPYDHGEIPVVMIRELPSPRSFWPPSTVQDLMPLQVEINVARSQVAEHKAATVDPRILVEKGHGMHKKSFTAPHELVELNPTFVSQGKIRPWVPEPLPAYMPYWETSLRSDFEDVSRNHAPSYGKQKGSVRSGRHAVALQEADARLNAPMMRMLRDDLGHVCRQWLKILRQYTDEERTITIIGENSEPEVLRWSRQDLPSAEFNVECDLGNALDRQTTIELIDMLTARGWLNPATSGDREIVYRWLGQGVTQEVDESQQDRSNASLENQEMLQGTLPPVSDGDDDTVHLMEHTKSQKSAEYRRQLRFDPELERVFLTHKRNHERQRIQKTVRQRIEAAELIRDMSAEAGLPPPGQPSQGPPGQQSPRQQPGGQRSPSRQQGGQSGAPAEVARRGSTRPPPQGFVRQRSGLFVPEKK